MDGKTIELLLVREKGAVSRNLINGPSSLGRTWAHDLFKCGPELRGRIENNGLPILFLSSKLSRILRHGEDIN